MLTLASGDGYLALGVGSGFETLRI